jgi:hypothetical protein
MHAVEIMSANVLDGRVSLAVREHLKGCQGKRTFFTRQGAEASGHPCEQCSTCSLWHPTGSITPRADVSQSEFPWDPASLRRRNTGSFS